MPVSAEGVKVELSSHAKRWLMNCMRNALILSILYVLKVSFGEDLVMKAQLRSRIAPCSLALSVARPRTRILLVISYTNVFRIATEGEDDIIFMKVLGGKILFPLNSL